MAATRENVLAAIVEYVENNKRRAPAKDIASVVNDTLPNVQAIIKTLVTEGAINSCRGRNGGALPDGVTLEKKAKAKVAATPKQDVPADTASESADPVEPAEDDTASQFAALLEKLNEDTAESEAALTM